MKNFMILVFALSLMLTFVGCNKDNPVGPTPACSLCAQQTQTAVAETATTIVLAVGTATATEVVVVNTATATQTSTEVLVVATATATSTTVVVATPTFTSTVNPNIREYYVEIKSINNQAGNVNVYVGKWTGSVIPTFTRTTYYMDATYSYIWTSTVIQTDFSTDTFHLEGNCSDQDVNIKVYRKLNALNPSSVFVLHTTWNATTGVDFSTND